MTLTVTLAESIFGVALIGDHLLGAGPPTPSESVQAFQDLLNVAGAMQHGDNR